VCFVYNSVLFDHETWARHCCCNERKTTGALATDLVTDKQAPGSLGTSAPAAVRGGGSAQ
jgi:hypothetical protein